MSLVLIVDDERSTREILTRWLGAEGYAVVEAADAESALRVLAEREVAVATLDNDIPPRVSLSRGIQGYLVKPLKRELVAQAVHDALAWHVVAAKHTRSD